MSQSVLAEQPEQLRPIGTWISVRAQENPDRLSVTCDGQSLTRAELESRANRLARGYADLGVGPGDLVTIALPNSLEFYVVVAAVWKLGAIPQPVSFRLPLLERQAIVDLAQPRLLVGVDPADHPDRTCLPAGFVPDPALSDAPLPEAVSPSWKAVTSGGSTGRPKIVVSGQSGLMPANYGAAFLMEPDDCQLVPGPLYHNGPFSMSFAGLVMGHHLVVMPRFDPVDALAAIAAHKVTWVNFVPTMMKRILRSEEAPSDADLSSLRVVWHMAAPCAPWLKDAWMDLVGPEKVFELYGGTEGQAMTMINGVEWRAHRGSVGRAFIGDVVVLDEHGKTTAPGVVGEIYLRRPEGRPATYSYIGATARERDGWESLGDLGWTDEDGYLYLSDRRTDLILSGGANIYPAEVELALEEHEQVLSSVVVGLPDDDLGQRVHAVVQTCDGQPLDGLQDFLRARLVTYKLPRTMEFVGTPLRDDAGKVRRTQVRDDIIARSASDPSLIT